MGETTQFIKRRASTASWKTSLAGIAAIASGIASLANTIKDQDWNMEHITNAVGSIVAGVGLLYFTLGTITNRLKTPG